MKNILYHAKSPNHNLKKRKFILLEHEDENECEENELEIVNNIFKNTLTNHSSKSFNKSGVRTEGRNIYFETDVSLYSVSDLKEELTYLGNKLLKDQIDNDTEEPLPIKLHIKSNGGTLIDGFDAVEYIKNCPVPVHTYVEGMVASAATLMSTVGSKRFMQPTAFMLIHELRSGVWGKMSEIEEEVDNLQKSSKLIKDFYLEHTLLSRTKLNDLLKKDINLTAKECLKYGLIDEIK